MPSQAITAGVRSLWGGLHNGFHQVSATRGLQSVLATNVNDRGPHSNLKRKAAVSPQLNRDPSALHFPGGASNAQKMRRKALLERDGLRDPVHGLGFGAASSFAPLSPSRHASPKKSPTTLKDPFLSESPSKHASHRHVSPLFRPFDAFDSSATTAAPPSKRAQSLSPIAALFDPALFANRAGSYSPIYTSFVVHAKRTAKSPLSASANAPAEPVSASSEPSAPMDLTASPSPTTSVTSSTVSPPVVDSSDSEAPGSAGARSPSPSSASAPSSGSESSLARPSSRMSPMPSLPRFVATSTSALRSLAQFTAAAATSSGPVSDVASVASSVETAKAKPVKARRARKQATTTRKAGETAAISGIVSVGPNNATNTTNTLIALSNLSFAQNRVSRGLNPFAETSYGLYCDEARQLTKWQLLPLMATVLEMTCEINQQREASLGTALSATPFTVPALPRVSIQDYLSRFMHKSYSSPQCYVLALVYIDRLADVKNQRRVTAAPLTVHRILLTSLVLATKYHDDIHIKNSDFAMLGGVPTKDLAQMEGDFFGRLNYELNVQPEQYDQYTNMLVQQHRMLMSN